jgi:hypothetical protein
MMQTVTTTSAVRYVSDSITTANAHSKTMGITARRTVSNHLSKTHMNFRPHMANRPAIKYGGLIGDDYRKGRISLEKNEFHNKEPDTADAPRQSSRNFIEKRCDSCQEIFLIPHVRGIELHRLICAMAICPHCNPNAKLCIGCHVPFKARVHYAKGMCRMCYRFHFQHEESTE